MINNDRRSAWLQWRNRYRKYIVWLLVLAAVINAMLHFWGEWVTFFGSLVGHFFFGQAIRAFLYDKDITFGPGGASMGDGIGARAIATTFAIAGYITMFFFFLPPPWK